MQTKRIRRIVGGAAVLVVAAVTVTAVGRPALAEPDGTATVLFGRAALGERPPTVRPDCSDDPLVPPGPRACFDSGHDASANALDDIVPRSVVIAEDGRVTFVRGGGNHQVAIYAPGTDVNALKAAVGTTTGFFNIDDPNAMLDRLYLGPRPTNWPVGVVGAITTPLGTAGQPGTFDRPGTYLLVCTFSSHFLELNMYGTIVVQPAP